MERILKIYFTSDVHGCFSALDYAAGGSAPTGLVSCMAGFEKDENTLILDGGDILQGSPFTYWLYGSSHREEGVPARLMNLAGYDFVTLGNHDFNYGRETLERHLSQLNARCLCANVEGLAGVEKTAVVTLGNGLRVGLTGVTSHFVTRWEPPEHLAGLTVTDEFAAAREALAALKAQNVDLTVCVYHGGFENDLSTGAPLPDTGENQGWRICRELDFDVLLTGHQHRPLENLCLFGTYTGQTPDQGRRFLQMELTVGDGGTIGGRSSLVDAGNRVHTAGAALLSPLERENARFLDTALGRLDRALEPEEPLEMALHFSPVAAFFNQVQLEASGADLSATCLSAGIRGFGRDVTLRDIAASYPFPNTLRTVRVDRTVLKAALERSFAFFRLDGDGQPQISGEFLTPVFQFYNFDFLSGAEVTADLRRDVGDRVVSIRFRGEELPGGKSLTLCLNSYRATGAGGYPLYAKCPLVRDQPTEISQLIADYVVRHGQITVDSKKWYRILY